MSRDVTMDDQTRIVVHARDNNLSTLGGCSPACRLVVLHHGRVLEELFVEPRVPRDSQ
jgi:hypothetical protein